MFGVLLGGEVDQSGGPRDNSKAYKCMPLFFNIHYQLTTCKTLNPKPICNFSIIFVVCEINSPWKLVFQNLNAKHELSWNSFLHTTSLSLLAIVVEFYMLITHLSWHTACIVRWTSKGFFLSKVEVQIVGMGGATLTLDHEINYDVSWRFWFCARSLSFNNFNS
jgi:hypothetical protein